MSDGVVLAAQEGPAAQLDLFNLLLVLVAAWVAGRLTTRLGYPAILGEILAGIVLGPPALGLLQAGASLDAIAELGVLLMMLYIGTEIDLHSLRKASVPGLLAAIGGFVVPFALGYWTILLFGGDTTTALLVGAAVAVTSLATKSRILVDLRLLDTRIAYVLMAAALLSDTATLVVFSGVLGFAEVGSFDLAGTALIAGEIVLFLAAVGVLGLVVLPRVGRWVRARGTLDRLGGFAIIVGVGLACGELAELAGLHGILGAFLAGMFLREGVFEPRTFHEANGLLRDVSIGLLAPVFFVTAGFEITFDVFQTDLALLLTILVAASVGKLFGTAIFYAFSGNGWREGLTIGAAMNGRGAVEIIVAGIALDMGFITQEIFSILVFMAIATTATVPILLKLGVDWLRRHEELVHTEQSRTLVLIVSAGPTAQEIADVLQQTREVVLIDSNPDAVGQARQRGFTVVEGNALDEGVLERARIAEAGLVLAMTPNSQVNVLVAQLARTTYFVPKVAIAVTSSLTRSLERLAAEVEAMPLFREGVSIRSWDDDLQREQAHLVEVEVEQETDGTPLLVGLQSGQSGFPIAVQRGTQRFPFPLVDDLMAGDLIIMLMRTTDAEKRGLGPFPQVI